jgi:hypothetical protein
MSAHLRPSPSIIRAWFFVLGITILACMVLFFDFSVQPLNVAASDDGHSTYSSWLR